MAELSRFLIHNEKRSREEHDEGQKQKALQEEKDQQNALSLQRRNHSHKKPRLTNNF
jgi:hypothetical protein